MTMTVLVPDEEGVAALRELDGVRAVRFEVGEPLPGQGRDAEVLVPDFRGRPTTKKFLTELPKLRLVQLLSAGAEHWIDVIPDGVLLSTARGAHGGSTAEWVVAALLSIYRELPGFAAAQQEGRWAQHMTDTLWGKRILGVGAGDLARNLIRQLTPFEASVTLVARTAREGVHGLDELPRLLGEHDAVVLVVPLTQ